MRRNRSGDPDVSVVVPIVERYSDLQRLHAEFSRQIAALGKSFEFIFVLDERLRAALPALRELQRDAEGDVVIVLMGGTFGEAAALTLGLERARGEMIVTLAAYFQVEARGIGAAFAALHEGAGVDLVVGRRHPRLGSWFNRLQTRLFHGIVRLLTGTRFHDISCGFKVMRRRVARELDLYGGLHRFIPILALNRGFAVREVDQPQHPEDRRTRYHGTSVYLGRLLDILTIFFLTKFTRMPLRFFGLLGTALFALGFGISLLAAVQKIFFDYGISDRAVLLLGVLLMVLGVQTLSLGLVGEIIIFTHARNVRDYQVAEVIRKPAPREVELPAASPAAASGIGHAATGM